LTVAQQNEKLFLLRSPVEQRAFSSHNGCKSALYSTEGVLEIDTANSTFLAPPQETLLIHCVATPGIVGQAHKEMHVTYFF